MRNTRSAKSLAHTRISVATLVMLAATVSLGASVLSFAQDLAPSTFIRFDLPGTAGNDPTVPQSISSRGLIGGSFNGPYRSHGFLRWPNGSFEKIDPPHSSTAGVSSVNVRGQAVGDFLDASGRHGFLRDNNGVYTQLDAPGASSTSVTGIGGNGQITGRASDSSGNHGFLWDPVNGFTMFDIPAANGGPVPVGINGSGVITGWYYDSLGRQHGFVRRRSGKIDTFEIGGNRTSTIPAAINNLGQVTGQFIDFGFGLSGFLRDANGDVTLFGTEFQGGPTPTGINDSGTIVGYRSIPDTFDNVAFVRDPAGNITFLSLPFPNLGSYAVGVSNNGQIVGYYPDNNGVNHGWLLLP